MAFPAQPIQRLPNDKIILAAAALMALAALLLAPFGLSAYWVRVLSSIFMFATLAQAINLIMGFAGYAAFGNIVFFGIGAYASAIVLIRGGSFALGVAAAVALCVVVVLFIAPVLMRLRGHYFAIATIGANEIAKTVALNWTSVTGGGMGLSIPLPPGGPAETAMFFYFVLLSIMLLSVLATLWVKHSRLGFACRAIRDDEIRAAAMGLRTTTVKTLAWTISAAFTGAVGATYAYWFSYVDPASVFDLLLAIKACLIFLLGGAGTVFGAVIAAFFVELSSTLIWSHLLRFHLGVLGCGFVLVAMFMPHGFMHFVRERWKAAAGR